MRNSICSKALAALEGGLPPGFILLYTPAAASQPHDTTSCLTAWPSGHPQERLLREAKCLTCLPGQSTEPQTLPYLLVQVQLTKLLK